MKSFSFGADLGKTDFTALESIQKAVEKIGPPLPREEWHSGLTVYAKLRLQSNVKKISESVFLCKSLWGIPIIVNEKMPPNRVEIWRDGKLVEELTLE